MTRIRLWIVVAASMAAAGAGFPDRARPQTVNVSVDATAPGTPLERVEPYTGYDEVNDSTAHPPPAIDSVFHYAIPLA